MRDRAESETRERTDYLVTVTAETDEMVRRAEYVADHGGSFVVVDVVTAGSSALQTVRRWTEDLGLGIHAHRDVLSVASGGLRPGIVDRLLDAVGTNVTVQAGGGVHGHPDGTEAGVRALREAVEVHADGESLESRADDVPVLSTALDEWGTDSLR